MITCKNCGKHFSGNYCNNCGEKVYTSHDKSVLHIFKEALHFITHFEGKFFTTIKTTFTKPGKFSLDYCNGLRKKYFKPVSLFLLFVVLYLLFPRFKGLNMLLGSYTIEKYNFTWVANPLINKKIDAKQIDYNEVAKRYDAKSSTISKISLFLLLPLASTVLLLLFYNTKKSYFDHFILGIELSAMAIAIHFLILPFFSFLTGCINKSWLVFFADENEWLTIFLIFIDIVIASLAFKKFYQQKLIWVIPKALIYAYIFWRLIIYLYHLLVLVVTLLLI
jgi:hypothetical protein